MEFLSFFRQVLGLVIAISLYWPLNIPFAALAYKVQNGTGPLPMTPLVYGLRSAAAGFGMAVLSVSLMGFDKMLTFISIPVGAVHILMCLTFLPLGAAWMTKAFALADVASGLSVLLLFVFLPGLILVVLKLCGLELPHFVDIDSWIEPIPA